MSAKIETVYMVFYFQWVLKNSIIIVFKFLIRLISDLHTYKSNGF